MQYITYLVTMNARIDQLVKSLLLKDSLEQCSLNEVEQFAARHPYFGAAQLLLTKKLQSENPARYPEQLEKTCLFFHNPLWVEQLLNDTGTAVITKAEPVAVSPAPPEVQPVLDIVQSEPLSMPGMEITTDAPAETEPETAPTTALQDTPGPDIAAENTVSIELPATEPIQPAEEPAPVLAAANTTENPEPGPDPFNPGMPGATDENALLFEPYHTVDYFASQGIRIREEDLPKDKFSQQLKSFTGWLKTLKKLPAAEIARGPVTVAEHKVEELAQHSLQEKAVFTEAMAEVWEKQGNTQKAIEIYRKLSLLEPAKSTYFAAKIEELKKST